MSSTVYIRWTDNEIRDKHIRYWVQTSLMIEIILRSWKSEKASSFQKWVAGRVAAFENVSYKQTDKLNLYYKKWSRYLTYLEKGQ